MLSTLLLLAGCAGPRLHSEAMKLLSEGNREAAIAKLREASVADPSNAEYRIELLKQTQDYVRQLDDKGDDARRLGQASEASSLYAKALKIEPGNDRARRGLMALELDARSTRLIADSERLMREGNLGAAQERAEAALSDNPASATAQRQLQQVKELVEKARQTRATQVAAQSVMTKPVTLQFRDANLRMVFEALSRTTGLNVILDRDVRADLKTTIFVKDAAVEDTVDLILLQNQLEKRALNANTLFIYPATPAKQKEYQDLQVRTFQVTNVDVKYLQSVLKSVLKIKEISVDEKNGTLVMRDTPDAIAVASKVIAAHDVPEPEVMLEVEVLEVSRERLTNLGLDLPNSFSLSTPDSAKTLGDLRSLGRNDLVASGLSVGLNFKLQDSDANLLASPRIRARNKEKARILIGDRIPTITNTLTPTTVGSGVVTGSVQYQEVGLKLEFEPQVYSDLEVGIKISLEVSSIAKEIPGPNGSLAYQIGTRNAQTAVRLRDGETQILGGLISAEDRNAAARLPGVGHLPMVGKLFGNNSGTDRKGEVILSITPRIVRAPAQLDPTVRKVYAGTESSIRERALQLDPIGEARGQTSGGAPGVAPGSFGGGNNTPPAGATGAVPFSARALPPARLPARTTPSAARPAAQPGGEPAAGEEASDEKAKDPAPAAPTESDKPKEDRQ